MKLPVAQASPSAGASGEIGGGVAFRYELWRKALHLGSAAAPLAYAAGTSRTTVLGVLVALAVLAVLVELARHRWTQLRFAFEHRLGPMLREHEHARWTGATWMLLSYVVVVWLAEPAVAIAAMWAVSVGDALAALVGRRWGAASRLGATGKSLAGSVTCFAVTVLGAVLLARLGLLVALAAGAAAALAEWPSRPGDDNVRIVVAVVAAVAAARWALALA